MGIIFFGSGKFAIPALDYLCNQDKYPLIAIVTQPDKKAGRGYKIQPTPVKQYYLRSKTSLPLFQPQDVNSPDFIQTLKNLEPDLFIVVSFGQIFKDEFLGLPKIFAVNIHASLLPKYRGAAPVNWAIINGEKTTGVTIFKIIKKMDAGEIIAQKECEISPYDTAVTLEEKLAHIGRELLVETLDKIARRDFSLVPQQGEPSYAPKLKKEDGLIDWNKSALQIYNLIRGTQPWPGAYSYFQGRLLKIFVVEIVEDLQVRTPGEIVRADKSKFVVACGKGGLNIKELQLESKRRVSAREFISGYRVRPGMKLGT
jgi:methionyl-tRNA formyltransferase